MCCPSAKVINDVDNDVIKSDTRSFLFIAIGGVHDDKLRDT